MTAQTEAENSPKRRRWEWALLAACLLVIPPLVGASFAGESIARYLNILPSTRYVQHAAFSWPIFILLAGLISACAGPFLYRLYRATTLEAGSPLADRYFPWWGWMGLVLVGVCWTLAWNAGETSNGWQRYTFTPLWIGYILVINGLSVWRSGRCLMLDQSKKFLMLFPVSAVFWWFFEYLNQFVHNWYYLGLGEITPLNRAISASLSFSTVLPAVLSTVYWMGTFSRVHQAYTHIWPFRVRFPRTWAVIGLVASTGSLFGLGRWPDAFFPLVWISPLIVLLSLLVLTGRRTVFSSLQDGDWRPFCVPALAGLQCGFFWELWNYGSHAQWAYSIPYVNSFHIFEMPLLGYAGYFPFGLECMLIMSLLRMQMPWQQVSVSQTEKSRVDASRRRPASLP